MDVLSRNHETVTGRGSRAMIFAHGFGCDQRMWRLVAPAFAQDYRVVQFDHVGSGRSAPSAYDPSKYASLKGGATDVLELCAELDLRDAVFVGHSCSAMIGVLAANREPARFSHLVLVCPSPRYINDDGYIGGFTRPGVDELLGILEANHVGWAEAMAPTIMGHPDRPELGQELEASFCSTDPAIARQFARVTFLSDNRTDLSRVTTPALILQCTDDVIAPLAVGAYCEQHIRGSTLVVMRATGHCPHLSAPEETIAAMEAFLAAHAVA